MAQPQAGQVAAIDRGAVEYAFDDVVSREEAACGVTGADQVGNPRTTVLAIDRPNIAATLDCLLERRSYLLILQYVLTLRTAGRDAEALRWNRRLAERVLADHGLSSDATPEQLGSLALAPHLDIIARTFIAVGQRAPGLVSPTDRRRWEALLAGQEREQREVIERAGRRPK